VNETLSRGVVVSVLNRLLRVLCRSLPRYLEHARPWSRGGGKSPSLAALDRLTGDLRRFAARVAEAIAEHGGQPDPGPFPAQFAAWNDVDLEYLLHKIIEGLRGDIEIAAHCAAELAIAPRLRALAEEVQGNLQGHAEQLQAVLGKSG